MTSSKRLDTAKSNKQMIRTVPRRSLSRLVISPRMTLADTAKQDIIAFLAAAFVLGSYWIIREYKFAFHGTRLQSQTGAGGVTTFPHHVDEPFPFALATHFYKQRPRGLSVEMKKRKAKNMTLLPLSGRRQRARVQELLGYLYPSQIDLASIACAGGRLA